MKAAIRFTRVPPMCLALLCSVIAPTSAATPPAQGEPEAASSNALCPPQLHRRSTAQVLEAHLAAVRSGNSVLVACDYARKAVLILPGATVIGRDQIEATFAGLLASAGPLYSLNVSSNTTYEQVVLLTYRLETQNFFVPGGVDTFVIENGRIQLQTVFLGGFTQR